MIACLIYCIAFALVFCIVHYVTFVLHSGGLDGLDMIRIDNTNFDMR